MATRVIEAGHAPTYGSDWSNIGQSINQGLGAVLGYYQEYQRQKRFEAQQKQEMQIRAQEMADRAEYRKAQREQMEDAANQRKALAATQRAVLMPTDVDPNQLPSEWVDTTTKTAPVFSALPDQAPEMAGPQASSIAVGEAQKEVKTPKTFVQYGDYVAPLDFGGAQAAARKQRERIESGQAVPATPELTAELARLGLGTFRDVVPAAIMGVYQQHLRDTSAEERAAARDAAQESRFVRSLAARGEKKTGTETADEIFPDLEGTDLLNAIRKHSPGTAAQLDGILSGKIDVAKSSSIRGNRREYLVSLASRIDPEYDMTLQPTRLATSREYTTGKSAQNIKSVNTALQHLGTLSEAVKSLDPYTWSTANTVRNWWKKKFDDPAITHMQSVMLSTATEMAKALKGNASPSETEINEQLKVLNESGGPEQWASVIRARAELLRAQLESQRAGWSVMGSKKLPSGFIYPSTRKALKTAGIEDVFSEFPAEQAAGGGGSADPWGVR